MKAKNKYIVKAIEGEMAIIYVLFDENDKREICPCSLCNQKVAACMREWIMLKMRRACVCGLQLNDFIFIFIYIFHLQCMKNCRIIDISRGGWHSFNLKLNLFTMR